MRKKCSKFTRGINLMYVACENVLFVMKVVVCICLNHRSSRSMDIADCVLCFADPALKGDMG